MIFESSQHIIQNNPLMIEVQFNWDTGKGIQTDKETFMDLILAKDYIESCQKTALLIRYERFLKDIEPLLLKDDKVIIQAWESLDYFFKKDIYTICKFIRQFETDLKKLIEAIKNENSISNPIKCNSDLMDIISFAKSITH
jgi:hypothetical protein